MVPSIDLVGIKVCKEGTELKTHEESSLRFRNDGGIQGSEETLSLDEMLQSSDEFLIIILKPKISIVYIIKFTYYLLIVTEKDQY